MAHFPVELQIRFERALVEGRYHAGDILSIADLAAQLGATTGEMRQVLQVEYRKGLATVRGETARVLGLSDVRLESVFQHTHKRGLKPSSVMRGITLEPASSDVSDRLNIEPGAPVYRLDRTRMANGEPLGNQSNYIPFEVCPGLEGDDVSHASFQTLMETKYHVAMSNIHDVFGQARATAEDAEILQIPVGSPVLAIWRTALSATGQPVVLTDLHIRTDRFQYVAALWPEARRWLEPARA